MNHEILRVFTPWKWRRIPTNPSPLHRKLPPAGHIPPEATSQQKPNTKLSRRYRAPNHCDRTLDLGHAYKFLFKRQRHIYCLTASCFVQTGRCLGLMQEPKHAPHPGPLEARKAARRGKKLHRHQPRRSHHPNLLQSLESRERRKETNPLGISLRNPIQRPSQSNALLADHKLSRQVHVPNIRTPHHLDDRLRT